MAGYGVQDGAQGIEDLIQDFILGIFHWRAGIRHQFVIPHTPSYQFGKRIHNGRIDHDIPVSQKRDKCMLSDLLPGISYGFAAAVTPGPLSMYLISQALAAGWRRALPVAFSPLISDGPVAVLILAVLSQVPSDIVQYLRIPGGLFMLYLALEAWKAWRAFDSGAAASAQSGPNNLWKAAVVNWLNPNLYLGWGIILGPIVLSGWQKSPAKGIAAVLGFYVTLIGTMTGMVILFAATRNLGPKVRKNLIFLSSIGLAVLGLYQLWLGISAIRK